MRLTTTTFFSDMPLKLKVKETLRTNITSLKIPTGGRQTSSLFASVFVVRVELGPT